MSYRMFRFGSQSTELMEPLIRIDPEDGEPLNTSGTSVFSSTNTPRTPLSHIDRMTKSPFQKLRQHHRIPYKFTLNVLVIIFLSAFYIMKNFQYSYYMDSNTAMLRSRLGNSADDWPMSEYGQTLIYTVDNFVNHFRTSMDNYWSFNESALSEYEVNQQLKLRVKYSNGTITSDVMTSENNRYGIIGQLNGSKLVEFLRVVDTLAIDYTFENLQKADHKHATVMDVHHRWHCNALYDLTYDNGCAVYQLRISNTILSTSQPVLLVISSIIITLCIPSAALTLRALWRSFGAFKYARTNLKRAPVMTSVNGGASRLPANEIMWHHLKLSDKLAFFNLWHVTTVLGDILLIIGGTLNYSKQLGYQTDKHDSLSSSDICHALGGFLVWVGMLKFYEWDSELYMLILSVKASLSRVSKFVFCVTPVYMAYVLVGVACFYDHQDLFGDIFKSSRTLFSLLNGDSVLAVFQELRENSDLGYDVFAQIYIYSFCIIFIVIICNVFIFIVESGYDAALNAVYGPEEVLSVFIDHQRLRDILLVASTRDPNHTYVPDSLLNQLEEPPSPELHHRLRLRRGSRGEINRSFRSHSFFRARSMDRMDQLGRAFGAGASFSGDNTHQTATPRASVPVTGTPAEQRAALAQNVQHLQARLQSLNSDMANTLQELQAANAQLQTLAAAEAAQTPDSEA